MKLSPRDQLTCVSIAVASHAKGYRAAPVGVCVPVFRIVGTLPFGTGVSLPLHEYMNLPRRLPRYAA